MDMRAAIRKHEDAILRLRNVTGLGQGEKDGRPVIKVFVTIKLPNSELSPADIVPAALEGFETDVEEIGVVTAAVGGP